MEAVPKPPESISGLRVQLHSLRNIGIRGREDCLDKRLVALKQMLQQSELFSEIVQLWYNIILRYIVYPMLEGR